MTDRKAKELGYIDVEFVDLTAELAREERRYHIIGGLFTVLCTVLGFMFWPMMIEWLTGTDVFDAAFNAGAFGITTLLTTCSITGILCGVVGMVAYRNKG